MTNSPRARWSGARTLLLACCGGALVTATLGAERSTRQWLERPDGPVRVAATEPVPHADGKEVMSVNGLRFQPSMAGVRETSPTMTEGRSSFVAFEEPFPVTGDAPGSDDPLVPRPTGSRRMLTAFVEGQREYVRLYASRSSVELVREEVCSGLRRFGWVQTSGAADYLVWRRQDAEILITISRSAEGDTHVVVLSSPRIVGGLRGDGSSGARSASSWTVVRRPWHLAALARPFDIGGLRRLVTT